MANLALASTRRIQLDKQGANTLIVGTAHPQDVGAFLIQIVNTGSYVGSLVVSGRIQVPDASNDGAPFAPIVYRAEYLNGAVSDGALRSDAITDSSLILVPASGMQIALVQSYTSGTAVAYVTPIRGINSLITTAAAVTDTVVHSVTMTFASSSSGLSAGGDPNDTLQYSLRALNIEGQTIPGAIFTADSSNTGHATTSVSGNLLTITMAGVGTAVITAHCSGVDSSGLTVTCAYVPTEMTASPSSISGSAGNTGTITATVLNHRGDVVPGQSITSATSDNTGVATLGTPSGLTVGYTLVASGSADFHLVSGSVSCDVIASVSAGSLTIFATHDFEDGTLGPYSDPFSFTAPGQTVVVDDPTPRAAGKVVSLHYLKIPANGTAGGTTNLGPLWVDTRSQHESFVIHKRWRHYFAATFTNSDGGVGPGDQRKISYDLSANATSNEQFSHLVIRGNGSLCCETGCTGPLGFNLAVNNFAQLFPLRWYEFEIRYKMNTNGNRDGEFTVWVNGVQVLHRTDAIWLQIAGDGFQNWNVGYEEIVDPYQDEFRYIDDWTFADGRIGVDATPTQLATVTDLFADATDFDGRAATNKTVNITAYNLGGLLLSTPSLTVSSSDESVATASLSGSVLTITRVGVGTATITLANGTVSLGIPGTVTAAFNLLTSLATDLGGDANFTIFSDLFPSSLTVSGGLLTAWADARGGGSPVTATAPTGHAPAYTSGVGAHFTGSEYLQTTTPLTGTDNWAQIVVATFDDPSASSAIVMMTRDAAATSYAALTSYAIGTGTIGGLLQGGGWIGTNKFYSDVATGLHVFGWKRESGTTSFNLDGSAISGGSSASPGVSFESSIIGGDSTGSNGFKGTIRATLWVNLDLGSGAVEAAINDLITAYS